MNSFITWIGGKKQLRETIVSRFPKEGIQKYVEVFGGAGWVLFHREKYAPKEVYNDINSNLVNLFRMMQHHPEAVEKELEYALNSREMYQMCRKTIDREDLTEIQRAARFLFLIKTSYGGKVSSFGCQTRDILQLKNLEEVKKRLSTVLIENRSFEELIKSMTEAVLYFIVTRHTTKQKNTMIQEILFLMQASTSFCGTSWRISKGNLCFPIMIIRLLGNCIRDLP